jgi:hypothetical protein
VLKILKMRNFTVLLFALFFVSTSGISQTKDRLPCIDKAFSLVVHIVRDSLSNPNVTEAAIQTSLAALNIDFAPICVSFNICEFRYIDNFAYDKIDTKKEWPEIQKQYNLKNRINVYYAADVVKDNSPVCGFAELGGITFVNQYGIVIKKTCLAGKTFSHEMGHYFGLKHTFEGSGTELANGSNCATAGDEICDTPADPFKEGDPTSGYVDSNCKFISMKKDANGQYYNPLVGNIMSYYPCSCGFTNQQYLKMATVYLSGTKEMW